MSIRPTTFAKYEYDGLNRRVKKHIDPVRTGRTAVRWRSPWTNARSSIRQAGAAAGVPVQAAPDDPDGVDIWRHFYYNAGWQILETRKSTTENRTPQDLNAEYEYVRGRCF